VAVACVLWVGSACDSSSPQAVASPSPSASASASPGGCPPGQAALPAGFPADFPIYRGAQLTAACLVTGSGATQWNVQWQTADKLNAVQDFYLSALDKNDWVLGNNSGDINTRFSATFQRKSNANVKGSLEVTNTGGPTKIALTLTP
jgi:hypothetical protein